MSAFQTITQTTSNDLEEAISRAISRVKGNKATDLCHYLPGKNGKLHHFAFVRLKKQRPAELHQMIREHILEKEVLGQLPPSKRADLKVKRTVEVKLKRSEIDRILEVMKKSGDKELLDLMSKFSPHQTLKQIQREMLDMVRAKEINPNLWATYVKMVEEEKGYSPD